MRTIIVKGGLGNQIYVYAFSLFLRKETGEDVRFLRRKRGRLSRIEDSELYSVFDVDIKSAGFMDRMRYKWNKLVKKKDAIAKDYRFSIDAPFFEGYWQDQKYFKDLPLDWLKFRNSALSTQNQKTIEDMEKTNSVFIHVRRGNYMNKRHFEVYGSVCTKEYYERAIGEIEKWVDNPQFFIFSNDIEWVEENLKMPNSQIITWNQAEDSHLDLYLMCHCKNAIIANSSFSYWGSKLLREKDVVVYPHKWLEPKHGCSDIIPSQWIGV